MCGWCGGVGVSGGVWVVVEGWVCEGGGGGVGVLRGGGG